GHRGQVAAAGAPLFVAAVPLAASTPAFALWGMTSAPDFFDSGFWLLLVMQAVNIPLLMLMASSVGTFFSVVCPTVRAATAWAYGVTVATYAITKHGVYLLALLGLRVRYEYIPWDAELVARLLFPWAVWAFLAVACFVGAHFFLGREMRRRA
ncbi:MAG: hypothetical protein ACE5O2_11390, partial [Armatimonadota bacterium]